MGESKRRLSVTISLLCRFNFRLKFHYFVGFRLEFISLFVASRYFFPRFGASQSE